LSLFDVIKHTVFVTKYWMLTKRLLTDYQKNDQERTTDRQNGKSKTPRPCFDRAICKNTSIIFWIEFCDWFFNSDNKIPNFHEEFKLNLICFGWGFPT